MNNHLGGEGSGEEERVLEDRGGPGNLQPQYCEEQQQRYKVRNIRRKTGQSPKNVFYSTGVYIVHFYH